jgi:ADP-heptose:LPS heptosyltransferase
MRILIVKLSSMGDTLHALPTVTELKRQLGAEIHWAVQPEFADLVGRFACVDRVLVVPRRGGWGERSGSVAALRAETYDLVVDLQGLLKSAVVARLARSPRRIGPSFHREGARLFYTEVAGPLDKSRHAVDECMDVLDALGLPRPSRALFPLNLPDMAASLGPGAGPRVAIAPLSRWATKNWPLAHFAEVARRLGTEFGAELHGIGGPADRPTVDRLAELAGVPLRNHCGEHDLAQTGGLLARMSLLLSNDSGPMHLAAALGVPCVVPFGPTLSGRTGPYGPGHRVLRLGNCPPCRSKVCRRGDAICLAQLSPDLVFAAARDVLGATR